jgi:hypothetical protein
MTSTTCATRDTSQTNATRICDWMVSISLATFDRQEMGDGREMGTPNRKQTYVINVVPVTCDVSFLAQIGYQPRHVTSFNIFPDRQMVPELSTDICQISFHCKDRRRHISISLHALQPWHRSARLQTSFTTAYFGYDSGHDGSSSQLYRCRRRARARRGTPPPSRTDRHRLPRRLIEAARELDGAGMSRR